MMTLEEFKDSMVWHLLEVQISMTHMVFNNTGFSYPIHIQEIYLSSVSNYHKIVDK